MSRIPRAVVCSKCGSNAWKWIGGWRNVFESEKSPDYSARLWTNTITRPDMRRLVTCLVLYTKKRCGLLLDVLHRLNYLSSVAVIISVAIFKNNKSRHFRLDDRNLNKIPPILTKPTMTCMQWWKLPVVFKTLKSIYDSGGWYVHEFYKINQKRRDVCSLLLADL
jgi:hypothetical protein